MAAATGISLIYLVGIFAFLSKHNSLAFGPLVCSTGFYRCTIGFDSCCSCNTNYGSNNCYDCEDDAECCTSCTNSYTGCGCTVPPPTPIPPPVVCSSVMVQDDISCENWCVRVTGTNSSGFSSPPITCCCGTMGNVNTIDGCVTIQCYGPMCTETCI